MGIAQKKGRERKGKEENTFQCVGKSRKGAKTLYLLY